VIRGSAPRRGEEERQRQDEQAEGVRAGSVAQHAQEVPAGEAADVADGVDESECHGSLGRREVLGGEAVEQGDRRLDAGAEAEPD
jgi:hypothetical protein